MRTVCGNCRICRLSVAGFLRCRHRFNVSGPADVVQPPRRRLSALRQRRFPHPAARASGHRQVRLHVAVLPGVVLQRAPRPPPRRRLPAAARPVDDHQRRRRRYPHRATVSFRPRQLTSSSYNYDSTSIRRPFD